MNEEKKREKKTLYEKLEIDNNSLGCTFVVLCLVIVMIGTAVGVFQAIFYGAYIATDTILVFLVSMGVFWLIMIKKW